MSRSSTHRAAPQNRPAAVAGSWYPSDPSRLRALLDAQLGDAGAERELRLARTGRAAGPQARLAGLIAPHAGLVYSGPVAAHAYRLLHDSELEVIVLVGPSHHVSFEGVSVWPRGAFETPLGPLAVDETLARELMALTPVVHERPAAHEREHSLEMQLPFLAHVVPGIRILPLVMGQQTRGTADALGSALAAALGSRQALLVASSDLSHFHDAHAAARLDHQVLAVVEQFQPETLMTLLERRPEHACGGGPMVSVLAAARSRGATRAEILRYADSGDVSGDKSSVVGYMAAAIW